MVRQPQSPRSCGLSLKKKEKSRSRGFDLIEYIIEKIKLST